MSRVQIIGIGSPSGDDQAGWLTVDALLALDLPIAEDDLLIHKLDRPGTHLVSLLDASDWVILVDAMQGNGSIGQIRRFDKGEWLGYRHGLSSHGIGVLDALSLARELDCMPAQLHLYGIEIGSANPGQLADDKVHAAARQLAGRIVADLAATTR